MLQTSRGRSGRQQQEQNSPNLGFSRTCHSYLARGLQVIKLLLWRRPGVLCDAESRPLEERVHVLHRLPDDLARCGALQVRRELQKPAQDQMRANLLGPKLILPIGCVKLGN